MTKHLTLRAKILLSSVLPIAAIMLAVTFIVIGQMKQLLLDAARDRIRTELTTAAQVIEEGNQETIAIARGLAAVQRAGLFGRRAETVSLVKQVLEDNSHLIGAYVGYEPDADGRDRLWRAEAARAGATDENGRFLPYWFRAPNAGGSLKLEPLADMETSLYYQGVKDEYGSRGPGAFVITEPYRYNDQNLIIEQVVPLIVDGRFSGIAGVDRGLDFLDSLLAGLKPFASARLTLVSGRGRVIATTLDDELDVDIRTMRVRDIYLTSDGRVPASLYKLEDGAWELDGNRATKQRLAGLSTGVRDRVRKLIEEADSATIHSYRAEAAGRPMLGAAARIPTGDWTLVFTVDRGEILGLYGNTLATLAGVAIAGFIISVATIILLITRITGRIQRAGDVARMVADGDLTAAVTVEASDESGQLQESVRDMIGSLRGLIARVGDAASSLSGIAVELFTDVERQERVVGEFGPATTQISAAARQISATSAQLAGTMEDVNNLATGAASLAGDGRQSLTGTAAAMDKLEASADAISQRLAEIEEKAAGIGVAVTTINKVADRTNMLSLNAAIEAEKAGEERAGFSIVAREVRRLADQTATATLDIGQIVRELQSAVTAGAREMESFSGEVRDGAAEVQSIGVQLEGVIDRVRKLTGEFSRVNEGMQLQSSGASQIHDSIEAFSGSVRQTGETLRDFRGASENLRGAVAGLRGAVGRFRTETDPEATA